METRIIKKHVKTDYAVIEYVGILSSAQKQHIGCEVKAENPAVNTVFFRRNVTLYKTEKVMI